MLVADAYLFKMTEALGQIVGGLGRPVLFEKHKDPHIDLNAKFCGGWGILANRTQTAYALSGTHEVCQMQIILIFCFGLTPVRLYRRPCDQC
ncbi:hypothetical protein CEP52_014871 [Fusarium oligoseptatum]|uniref:Uncharacterized protein n=1 Tax=Fusarium oligoseptatum TaxID=2604345 RepID=A0A428SIE5_9HYPO|nr:hypothetical protein CEP52_014871 [Fusarium oligoseptatum]